jgi:preprotein translocase subunit SecG
MGWMTILNILYVLIAIAMTGFILVQRGAGAQAGSGFGAGASATVFGARGAGNVLTKSTAVLAASFFVLSLGMGIYVSRSGVARAPQGGVMDEVPAETVPAPAASLEVPAAPAATAPAAPATDVPAAPAQDAAPAQPEPAEAAEADGKQ